MNADAAVRYFKRSSEHIGTTIALLFAVRQKSCQFGGWRAALSQFG
jgi:hypothetical protein